MPTKTKLAPKRRKVPTKKTPKTYRYRVMVQEVHTQPVLVEATNEKEAILLVAEGQGCVLIHEIKFNHALDTETWAVEREEN
jgi:hypothetical protein